jgi:hypothetical protein
MRAAGLLRFLWSGGMLLLLGLSSPNSSAVDAGLRAVDAFGLRHLRAVHMGGHWAHNPQGVRAWRDARLVAGKPLTASSVDVTVRHSSSTDATGMTQSSDAAEVRLTDVRIGTDIHLQRAGFWVVHDLTSGARYIQFRPSIDRNLAGVTGFAGDLSLFLSGDAGSGNWDDVESATGIAAEFVAAVLTAGPELFESATFDTRAPATLDLAGVAATLRGLQGRIATASQSYIEFLRSLNVQWVGISVAMFVDSVADPTVRLHFRPAGQSGGIYTFDDDDLRGFVSMLRAAGLRIYLTLAFQTLAGNPAESPTGPHCGKATFVPPRWLFGGHALNPREAIEGCIDPELWWWNPDHPQHAPNVAAFFASYQAVAVRYASMARELGVEIYSIGTETDRLFRARPSLGWPTHFGPQLHAMVDAVRAEYAGILTYDQLSEVQTKPDFYGAGGQHLFGDLGLDAVGVSAYFALVPSEPGRLMSVAELEAAWLPVFEQYLVPLQQRNPGRPVLFTEVGYTDHLASPAQPAAGEWQPVEGRDATGVTEGMRQQQRIVEAFFRVNDRFGQLVRGAFWWDNGTVAGAQDIRCTLISFGSYCKPLAGSLAAAYADWQRRDVERLFDWAEVRYGSYFPGHSSTASADGYLYRYYPATGNYVGAKGGRVVVHNGRDWLFLDVGSVADYVDWAAREGY